MSDKSLPLLVVEDSQGRTLLKCPGVGLWIGAPSAGQLVIAGQSVGRLRTLGRETELVVPSEVSGRIWELAAQPGAALEYGQALLALGEISGDQKSETQLVAAARTTQSGALVFASHSSGRYYSRPSPDKPEFVSVGDEIEIGHTVYLLEVMKTFSRVAYEGEGLPARARVLRILPNDGDDLTPGQIVLELEAI
ncbi:MAG: hypothetical protein JKY56_04610 [Kofleriaceae bacterium]|nr:hypothetical protein [Kofleriaceae bacterium]